MQAAQASAEQIRLVGQASWEAAQGAIEQAQPGTAQTAEEQTLSEAAQSV